MYKFLRKVFRRRTDQEELRDRLICSSNSIGNTALLTSAEPRILAGNLLESEVK